MRIFCCYVVAVFAGAVSLVTGVLAIWLNLSDLEYAASVLLTVLSLFSGMAASKVWPAKSYDSTDSPSEGIGTVRDLSYGHASDDSAPAIDEAWRT